MESQDFCYLESSWRVEYKRRIYFARHDREESGSISQFISARRSICQLVLAIIKAANGLFLPPKVEGEGSWRSMHVILILVGKKCDFRVNKFDENSNAYCTSFLYWNFLFKPLWDHACAVRPTKVRFLPFPPPLVLACLLPFVNIGVKFETLAKLSQQW